jgi:hypothetical protein
MVLIHVDSYYLPLGMLELIKNIDRLQGIMIIVVESSYSERCIRKNFNQDHIWISYSTIISAMHALYNVNEQPNSLQSI